MLHSQLLISIIMCVIIIVLFTESDMNWLLMWWLAYLQIIMMLVMILFCYNENADR